MTDHPSIEQQLWSIASDCERAAQIAKDLMRERSLHTSATTAEQEIARLRRAISMIEIQDQGCGGNLTGDEIYKAMKRLCREALA